VSGFPGDLIESLCGENEQLVAEVIQEEEGKLGRQLTKLGKQCLELFLTDVDQVSGAL
jgi:hypothetical protein